MKFYIASVILFAQELVNGQQAGYLEQEVNPTITLKECTIEGGCTSSQAKLTLDANWRWIHATSGYENCYTGDTWNSQYCSDPNQCAQNCALEGVSSEKYENTYGIQQIQDGVKLKFVTEHEYGTNVGSRLYLMENDENYKLFYLKNREFSYEVDVSELQCGMNGAMYFCEMPANGGKGIGNNNAGAKFGTGYCDAQCPHDMKFIDGEANVIDWAPNPNDKSNNMGGGKYGSCCAEMDIWEANSMATAYTPHTCGIEGLLRCEGIECGDNDKGERYDGVCDKDGCDINPYRMGNTEFYGRGSQYQVNTLKPMTVVTQFVTTDGTDNGDLSEIRRFYVQDGEVIYSPSSTILGPDDTDEITDGFCEAKKELFGDVNHFQELGGMKAMGESLDRGHVMIFSLWDDVEVNMLWLDSAYPLDKPATDPGVQRGDCVGGESSTPTYLRETYPNGYVSFKNAAVGEIGSTLLPANPTAPSPSAPSPTSPGGGDGCGCGPANGMNQPECTGKSETQCNHMVNYEGKCKWTVCSPPTPAPITQTFPPTKPPTNSPNSFPNGCYSINNKDCIHPAYDSSSCTKIWLPNGARNDCVALGGECMSSACCEPAECVGDENYTSCLPNSETTSEPTKAPTEAFPSSPPSSSCTICDDEPTNGMKKKGKSCTDINLKKKCSKNASWINKGFCQLSCYNEGLGYDGDICCTDTS
jgi:cellulose 1,4-beta-cellobiosidase